MSRVIVFLKYPQAGQVKTRLATEVGDVTVVRLARHFAEVTLAAVESLGLPVDISFDPPERESEMRAWLGPRHVYAPQHGANLGERMAQAFETAFARGARRVALTGTDAPDRPAEFLTEALERLEDHEAVICPALDGGYHLLALRPEGFRPQIFQNIAWGTARVLEQTLDSLRQVGFRTWILPPWPDIDDRAALMAYLARCPEAASLLEDDHAE